MKSFKIVLFSLVTSAFLVAAPNTPPSFESYDKDGDGIITEVEYDTAKAERMTQKAEEGKQLRNAGNSPTFADFDKDGDGKITKEELLMMQQERMQNHQQNMQKGKGNKGMM